MAEKDVNGHTSSLLNEGFQISFMICVKVTDIAFQWLAKHIQNKCYYYCLAASVHLLCGCVFYPGMSLRAVFLYLLCETARILA